MTRIFRTFLLTGVAAAMTMTMTMTAIDAQAQTAPAQPKAAATAQAAGQTNGSQDFIRSMGDRGINFLGNQSMTIEAKQDAFRKLLNDSFDMNTIARFTLGQYWRVATPAQQQEYLKLFNEMIVRVYSRRFSDYKGQAFEVRSSQPQSNGDVLVNSFVVPNGSPEVRVDWRVRNKGGTYKVVDIMVEGVSMAQTQRADFASVIQRGGGKVESLLDYMRKS